MQEEHFTNEPVTAETAARTYGDLLEIALNPPEGYMGPGEATVAYLDDVSNRGLDTGLPADQEVKIRDTASQQRRNERARHDEAMQDIDTGGRGLRELSRLAANLNQMLARQNISADERSKFDAIGLDMARALELASRGFNGLAGPTQRLDSVRRQAEVPEWSQQAATGTTAYRPEHGKI
jgi:hypothetical protein